MNDIDQPDPVIDTYRGQLNLLHPAPWQVNLQDVSIALSRVPRYAGQTRVPWTVGQHSLLCADIVEFLLSDECEGPELAGTLLLTLWHDAAEAYIGDLTRPLKRLLGRAYYDIEGPVQKACDLRLVGRERTPLDKIMQQRYDNIAIAAEVSTLNGAGWLERVGWAGLPPLSLPVVEYAHVRVLEYMERTPESIREELETSHFKMRAAARETKENQHEPR